LSLIGAGKVVVLLVMVSAIVGLQMAVLLTHPTTSDLVGVYAASGQKNPPSTSTTNSTLIIFSSSSSVSTSSSKASTTQATSQPPTSTLPPQTVTASITVVQPQVIRAEDYTPIGVAIVAAVGILGLVVLFFRRMR